MNILAIEKLEGGAYNVDSIIKAIQTFSNWSLKIGIALGGVSLIIGFILVFILNILGLSFTIFNICFFINSPLVISIT